jgi:diguanylate cyclase (GGDEF)-like protein
MPYVASTATRSCRGPRIDPWCGGSGGFLLRSTEGVRSEEAGFRRVYLVAIAVPLAVVVAVWATIGTPSPFLRVATPAAGVYLGVLLVGVWSRLIPLRVAGHLMFLGPVVVVFSRLVLWRLGLLPETGALGDAITMAAWVPAIFLLAFLVFGTRRGLQVSILVYLGFVAVYGPTAVAVLLGRASGTSALVAHTMTVSYLVLLPLTWALASRLERLVAERARADVLAEQATTDPLTGIANRRLLDDELGRMIAQAHRYGLPLSVVLMDLDHFKAVNDEHGHDTGDRVLVETVERVEASVRDADLLGRWGGEEFLLLAPHTDHEAACALAERCRAAIGGTAMEVGEITASFGVATLDAADDARTLFRRADLALYTAKQEGRDRVVGIIPPDSPGDVDPERDRSARPPGAS